MIIKKLNIVQKAAWVYAVGFFAIVSLNYIPFIHDAEGNMFGLFRLDLIDDLVHLFTAIWAGYAAFKSFSHSVIFFKVFGTFYFLDGIVCLIGGQCIADFTFFINSNEISILSASNLVERFFLNIPHIIIGAVAIYVGFKMSKRLVNTNK